MSSLSQAPTAAVESPAAPIAAAAAAAIPAPVGRLISSDSLPVGGFTPGMVLAGRYRIIGLIGRGGMGEVYRADDLKLGQPVALKFLPKVLADDPVRRERLFAEVRIARQVSHPNICRVYDIGELEGRHFLTMEYIDGEDLASLLKRIGSLHGAKAVDVAQQLCAGLAAAHDKGVLHRDLKPANVMIDGRGRVRITDFGLAVAAGEEIPEADVSGTPPYMAPEQFAGKGASVRSDIYALGLIFYEIFTGRRAFEAKTLAELRSRKETSSPTAPSEIVRDIDPIVERVILRCIEKDPRQRPASAAQVAAALPGGDPLAAAIAAGETPSPEMVAAAGSTEGLKPWIAWACLALVIASISASVAMKPKAMLFLRSPVSMAPEALALKAQEILRDAGYPESPADSAFGFLANEAVLQQIEKSDKSQDRFSKLPPSAIQFWYRQSPRPIEYGGTSSGNVTPTDPPFRISGEAIVWLDSHGHLTRVRVMPPEQRNLNAAPQQPDWSVLFKAAGLDKSKFADAPPVRTPPDYGDTRAGWTGALPGFADQPIRIEAAAFDGKPVWWSLIETSSPGPSTESIYGSVILLFILVVFAGAAFLARRNLRMGRGDRAGAFRLAILMLILYGLEWLFSEHHVATYSELFQFLASASTCLFFAGAIWLCYIALEPIVRRRWPEMLISWNRILSGSFRDPLVGRDLIIGWTTGAAITALLFLRYPVSKLLGAAEPWPYSSPNMLLLLSGAPGIIAGILSSFSGAILAGFVILFLLLLPRIFLRSAWISTTFFIILLAGIALIANQTGYGGWLILSVVTLIETLIIYLVVLRFGLLACVSAMCCNILLFNFPITTRSGWYSSVGLTGLAILLAFALYAFHTSLGGQPLFGRASLED